MNQPVPTVSSEDLVRLVHRDFPVDEVSAVITQLEVYGSKEWHRETLRVRADILKLAGGDPKEVEVLLRAADQDHRDIISQVEYPRYLTQIMPDESDPIKRASAIQSDWEDYQRWFERK